MFEKKFWRLFIVTVLLLISLPAQAIITITLTEGGEGGVPIAIVPFEWKGAGKLPEDISGIVHTDLKRSGRFSPLERKQLPAEPSNDKDVDFKTWRLVKTVALVIGTVKAVKNSRYRIEFRLYDVFRGRQLAGYRYTVPANRMRSIAHQISDIVYKKLTGERGVFTTRIAYISQEQKNGKPLFRLAVADSDGVNPQTIVTSREPLMSPVWSPDGKKLAYVSFEQKRSIIYVQNLADGKRKQVAAHNGINSAPAWSPDGRKLALTLSRDGNPEIYLLDLKKNSLQRLSFHRAIDTEPAWSPDGKNLVFTSDRAGQPQLYRMSVQGGRVERLTFDGSYNAGASFSPDGNSVAFVTRHKGRFNIGMYNFEQSSIQVLTDTRLDESPTFSPNGRMILYATEHKGRGVLASVSADGRVRQLFTLSEGNIREPAWSPFKH